MAYKIIVMTLIMVMMMEKGDEGNTERLGLFDCCCDTFAILISTVGHEDRPRLSNYPNRLLIFSLHEDAHGQNVQHSMSTRGFMLVNYPVPQPGTCGIYRVTIGSQRSMYCPPHIPKS